MPKSQSTEFGNRVKAARIAAGLTQADLAAAVGSRLGGSSNGISQTTVSAWEVGRQTPNKNAVEAIAAELDLDKNELWELCSQERLTKQPTAGLSVDRYFVAASNHLREIDYDCDLWFVGPNELPVLDNRKRITEIWLDNYRHGVTYHAIWFVEHVSENAFRRTAALLVDLAKEADSYGLEHAFFINHLTSTYENPQERRRFAVINEDYDRLGTSLARADSKSIQLKEPRYGLPDECRRGFLNYVQGFSTILLYEPRDFANAPIASLCLRDIQTIDGVSEIDIFHWFGAEDCRQISSIVRTFARHDTEQRESK